ncbi:MAG: strawberry notch family protein [Hyphomicrobiales bacterium]|nr:strawberry notch family protein [Hyphomicrobiales bacterium]
MADPALDLTGLRPLDTGGLKPISPEELGTAQMPRLDVSSLKPLDVGGLKPIDDDGSWTDYPVEFGKGFAEGGKNLVAGALKGYGAAAPVIAERQIEALDQINAPPLDESPEERAAYRLRRGVVHPPEEVIARRRAVLEERRDTPIQDQPLYRAGAAIEEFGKEALAPRPGFEPGHSWTRDIGSAGGSMAAGVATSLIPGAGPALAATVFLGAGMGEAVDKAIREGATEEEARRAAELGTIAGATDMVDALLPHLGTTGKVMGFIRRVGTRAIYGALAEGGQEGLQQVIQNAIAQGIYKPNQDLFEDVPRSIAIGMIVGGVTAGGFSAAEGRAHGVAPVTTEPAVFSTGTAVLSTEPADFSIPAGAVPATSVLAEAPDDRENQPGLSGQIRGWPQPVQAQPLQGAGGAPVEAGRVVQGAQAGPAPQSLDQAGASVAAAPVVSPAVSPPPGADLTSRDTLERLLADPRSTDEIRQEIARVRAEAEAARTWRATEAWEPIPRAALGTIDEAGLEFRAGENGAILARLAPAPGSREAPVRIETAADVHVGAEQTARPTPAQAEAGNYRKRHLKWQGLDISIEVEAGSERSGVGADGKPWSVTLNHPYGYFRNSTARDGDSVDVYIGPDPASGKAFVVDQVDLNGRYDEAKVVISATDLSQARNIYEASFSDGSGASRIGGITELSVEELKTWLARGDTKRALSAVREGLASGTRADRANKRPPSGGAARSPLSLLQFLATNGGLKLDPGGELKALGITSRSRMVVPGLGYRSIIRKDGMSLDRARELAVMAGYLTEPGRLSGNLDQTTPNDLLRLISEELGGRRTFAPGEELTDVDQHAARAREIAQERLADAASDVVAAMAEHSLLADDAQVREAAELTLTQGIDAEDAITAVLERDALAVIEEGAQTQRQEPTHAEAADHRGTSGGSEAGAPAIEQPAHQGRVETAPAPRRVEPGEDQRDRVPQGGTADVTPSTEPGTDNKPQLVLPGAEKIGQAEQAQRGAEKPLKPKVAQKSADEGLFGDGHKQADLVDLAGKRQAPPMGAKQFHVIAFPHQASERGFLSPPIASFSASSSNELRRELARIQPMLQEALKGRPQQFYLVFDVPGVAAGGGRKESRLEIVQDHSRNGKYEYGMPPQLLSNIAVPLGFFDLDTAEHLWTNAIIGEHDQRDFYSKLHGTIDDALKEPPELPSAAIIPFKSKSGGPGKTGASAVLEEPQKVTPRPAPSESLQTPSGAKPTAPKTDEITKSEAPETGPLDSRAYNTVALARIFAGDLANNKTITTAYMQHKAAQAFGGKMSEGKFDRKDMFDALELAVNLRVKEDPGLRVVNGGWQHASQQLAKLITELPTQTVRSEEQERFQQFSTPPHYALAVAYGANLRDGDVVLEPSAGTGSLVAAATHPGVEIIANELSERRADLLEALVGTDGRVFSENAEQINNVLPKNIRPTVVVMNPPFSQTAGRMGDKRDINVGANHIEQALKRLAPGGRLVAIVGRGMTMGAPRFRQWWERISKDNTVRANIGVDGSVYGKYGTNFGTRLLVIDKMVPTGEKPVLIEVQTVDDLMRALEPIRNARPAAEQKLAESVRAEVAEGGQGGRGAARPPSAQLGMVGAGKRGERGVAEPRPAVVADPSRHDGGVAGSERARVPAVKSRGRQRPGGEPAAGAPARTEPEGRRGAGAEPTLQPDAGRASSTAAGSERIEIENAAPGTQTAAEISDSLYEPYEPKQVRIKGAKKHPGPLVESAAMSSVDLPAPTYRPTLPRKVIDEGRLSLPQLEAVIYAGQSHERMLPAADGETARRRGFFVGDGTGVGKGREIAGIILDNWQQGRTKAAWVSEKRKLLNDAKRDWTGLGQDGNLIFNVGKTKTGEPIKADRGIGFITYDTLKGGISDQAALARGGFVRGETVKVTEPTSLFSGQTATVTGKQVKKAGELFQPLEFEDGTKVAIPVAHLQRVGEAATLKSRVDQIVEWLGHDFDGIVAFDECVPAGTMIATPDGVSPIEELKVGDKVLGFEHQTGLVITTQVVRTFRRTTTAKLRRVGLVEMTGNHPVWTENAGYIPSICIHENDVVRYLCPHGRGTYLQKLREGIPCQAAAAKQPESLLQPLLHYAGHSSAPRIGAIENVGTASQGTRRSIAPTTGALEGNRWLSVGAAEISVVRSQPLQEHRGDEETCWELLQLWTRRQWQAIAACASDTFLALGRVLGMRVPNRGLATAQGIPALLPRGHCGAEHIVGDRGRWLQPSERRTAQKGCQENVLSRITRVDGTQILELGGAEEDRGGDDHNRGCRETEVFNIETGTANYFANRLLVHNSHNMANAVATKEGGREKDAAQKALAGVLLQERLPNARVVYVSATGATEVANLAYADRLGLWGRGTPFASSNNFIAEVEQGGIAAMELIARDMKQLGLYLARNLSYDGVEYNRVEHKLDPAQREIYDTLADAWQVVLRNINAALETTNGNKDWRARAAASAAFWSAHQRFFNQVVTSLQMPSVIKAVEADLKAGRQVVLQLTNTNEAAQERAAAKAETAEDIEDLDITPRDQIIQLVERAFPTQEYEEYLDEDGKRRVRPVVDSAGKPVENAEAVAMRDALIEKLAALKVPQGPLDMILDHFGVDAVAEVTGRGRRFVLKPDQRTGEMRRVEESRPGSSNQAETDAFQAGKKKVLVFSEAGGTGASYHADNQSASKKARRSHYLVQAGWRADKAVQGFGRTHRSDQASAPIFHLVTTDLDGQKRFISSIARRLGQLGALTKGQRQAGDQGIFSSRDNLESREARDALRQFLTDVVNKRAEGIDLDEFEQQTGLALRIRDQDGRILGTNVDIPITQFLNRLLSLKIDLQNRVFAAFSEKLDGVIEARQQAGLLDVGLETVRADKITKDTDRAVHADKESGAETKYVKLVLADRFKPIPFEDVANSKAREIKLWARSPQGKVYGVAEAPTSTRADGTIVEQYRIIGPAAASRLIARANITGRDSKWSRIEKDHAEKLWQQETKAAPEFIERDLHLITGAILPIWDRLKGSPRVVRLQTDQGERLIGRVVPEQGLADTLRALGTESDGKKIDPADLLAALMRGSRARLANGWVLKRSRVANEERIELIGPRAYSEGQQIKQDGVFTEKIAYELRYFVPTDKAAATRTLAALTEHRPVVETTGPRQESEPESLASVLSPSDPRHRGIPFAASEPIATFKNDQPLKHHPDYKAAKSGDTLAAGRLARDLVTAENIDAARQRFVADAIYIPVIAIEQSGHNRIPRALAEWYAAQTGADTAAAGVVQSNRAYHTGAGPMERLAARARFEGAIKPGGKYVLVDDVSVMGSTLADLADYIQRNGGEVIGAVLLANAGRSGVLTPTRAVIRDIERRYGDAIRENFDIEPAGLTADEAAYIRNFRDARALREGVAKARRQRSERLASKGIREGEAGEVASPEENSGPGGAASDSGPLASVARPVPGLYSAVLRTVEGVKLPKAPAAQWLNTLRNAPGVKAEEMDWLGLPEWLKEQKGAITKEQVVDFVRANQIEVREVVHEGAGVYRVYDSGGEWPDTYTSKQAALDARDDFAREEGAREWKLKAPRYSEDQWELHNRNTDEIQHFDTEEEAQEAYDREVDRSERDWLKDIRIREEVEGGVKFSSWMTPKGGKNEREIVLTLPPTEKPSQWTAKEDAAIRLLGGTPPKRTDYRVPSGHEYGDRESDTNRLAHIFIDDRIIDGKRTLLIREGQSDWHQAGHKEGYRSHPPFDEAFEIRHPTEDERNRGVAEMWIAARHGEQGGIDYIRGGGQTAEEARAVALRHPRLWDKWQRGVPDAPFKTTWPDLIIKRMVRWAAENGYDNLAWVTGDTVADRYDLSKHVRKLTLSSEGSQYKIVAIDHDNKKVVERYAKDESEVADLVGKDNAEKLFSNRNSHGAATLEGLDLKIGGRFHKELYDQRFVQAANKLGKKYGAKVGRAELQAVSVHVLPISPELRAAATGEGFPLFKGGVAADTLTPAARRRRADLEAMLSQLVEKMVGHKVRVEFAPGQRLEAKRPAQGYGSAARGQAPKALYFPADRLIRIALGSADPRSSAFHEAWHDIEIHLLDDKQVALLKRETERLRAVVQKEFGLSESEAKDLAGFEIRAMAFELYARAREQNHRGIIPNAGLRALLDRILHLVRQVRNGLSGMGFKTTEDIFAKGYEGGFRESADRGQRSTDSLASVLGPETPASERADAAQGFIARGQPIDRAIRVPFDIFGGTTADGKWKPGQALWEKDPGTVGGALIGAGMGAMTAGPVGAAAGAALGGAAGKLLNARFSPEGRFAFMNPLFETVRSGLVDRYNLRDLPGYVEREHQVKLDKHAIMLQGAEIMKTLRAHAVGPAEAKVLQAILTDGEVSDADMQALAEPIRAAIDQLGQEAVALGLLSRDSFERNRGAYLHRVYQKYETSQNAVTGIVNKIMGGLRHRIVGNQLRGRGMFHEIALPRLMRDVPDWTEAGRGKPERGEKFIRLDELSEQQEMELDGDAPPQSVLRTVWWPADQSVPDRYSAFRRDGVWEVRGERRNDKLVVWRDFTKPERERMGEILDARYTIAKTFMLMAHDLANGRFFKDIAENEDWASRTQPDGTVADAEEWRSNLGAHRARQFDWIRVPDTAIPNSGGKKRYGALAGMYVREEIWRDLHEIETMSNPRGIASYWRPLLSHWKQNKTVRSPVVHMNNVMSNFMFMDLADVRMQDLVAGLRSYTRGDADYREAFENGTFGADMIANEIRENVLKPILDEIATEMTTASASRLGALWQVSKYTNLLWSKLKAVDSRFKQAYEVEDEVFRMAMYLRRRQLGDDPKTAARSAREQFIDYDIRAPWVRAARNSVLPFISYTYRAIPLVAKAVATRPWKLAKYSMLAYAANALTYALMGGDEEKERKSLQEKEQGRTWLGGYRMTRMPFNDKHGNPIFLDIRRWVPAGDVFDLGDGDIPAWMNVGGPLMIGSELALNRAAFTGRNIFNTQTDDWWDRQAKRGDHLYKSWMPSAAYIPGSWYWERVGNAIKGATDRQRQPYSIPLALSSSVGVKLKPQDVQDAMAKKGQEFARIERALKDEARLITQHHQRGLISEAEFGREMNAIMKKMERLGEKARETFK